MKKPVNSGAEIVGSGMLFTAVAPVYRHDVDHDGPPHTHHGTAPYRHPAEPGAVALSTSRSPITRRQLI